MKLKTLSTLIFTSVLFVLLCTACSSLENGVEKKTIYIGAKEVDCEGSGPRKCLLIKETVDAEYKYFYDHIEGFEWEPGYEYELRIEVSKKESVPMDSSSLRYKLIEVVSKREAPND